MEAAAADAAAETQRVAEEAAAQAGELQRAADAAAAQRAMVIEFNKIRTQVNEMHEAYRQRNAGRDPRRRDLPDSYQVLAARYEELKELLPASVSSPQPQKQRRAPMAALDARAQHCCRGLRDPSSRIRHPG